MKKDPEDMTDKELLESIAHLDPEEYPLAKWARQGLRNMGEPVPEEDE